MRYWRELFMAVLVMAVLYLLFLKEPDYSRDHHIRIIDSLENTARDFRKKAQVAEDSTRYYIIMAREAFERANRDPKVLTRTVYAQDTSRNRKLSVLQRDSIIRSIFYKK